MPLIFPGAQNRKTVVKPSTNLTDHVSLIKGRHWFWNLLQLLINRRYDSGLQIRHFQEGEIDSEADHPEPLLVSRQEHASFSFLHPCSEGHTPKPCKKCPESHEL